MIFEVPAGTSFTGSFSAWGVANSGISINGVDNPGYGLTMPFMCPLNIDGPAIVTVNNAITSILLSGEIA